VFLFVGWYIGYDQGVMNQVYYDAPAKAVLLQKALKDDGTVDDRIIIVLLFRQKCILSYKEDFASEISVYHPVHEEVRHYYELKIKEVCGDDGCTCDPEQLDKQIKRFARANRDKHEHEQRESERDQSPLSDGRDR
jgi:hypothetical protein